MEHTAYVEQGEEAAYQKHFFVHIGNTLSYTDPLLEVNITSQTAFCELLWNLLDFSYGNEVPTSVSNTQPVEQQILCREAHLVVNIYAAVFELIKSSTYFLDLRKILC